MGLSIIDLCPANYPTHADLSNRMQHDFYEVFEFVTESLNNQHFHSHYYTLSSAESGSG